MPPRPDAASATPAAPAPRSPVKPRFVVARPRPTYRSLWAHRNQAALDVGAMRAAMTEGCRWLAERAMFDGDELPAEQNPSGYDYPTWRGAVREYDARTGRWSVFGPLWHTGQAVKALVLAHEVLGEPWLLEAARRGGAFLLAGRISDPTDPDHGVILACENDDASISATSCMLESLDGLIHLARATGEDHYWDAVLDCLRWAQRRLFLPDQGLFLDDFDMQRRQARIAPNTRLHEVPGRPLLEDAVYLQAYQRTGDEAFRAVFFTVAERLLAEEGPPGNWIAFPPCDQVAGLIHPRHGYWWGRPMLAAWQASGDDRYLACARRVGHWYRRAQRLDGGLFRVTRRDFATTTTGTVTSGAMCAACLWGDLIRLGHGKPFRDPWQRAMRFAHAMQLTNPSNPALRGAVIESIEPPDGTDRPPFHVRDLATIFFVQAAAEAFRHGLWG